VIELFSSHRISQLGELTTGQEVVIGGMLTQVRLLNTKKARNGNTRYCRYKLEDFTGSTECVMWPDVYERFKELVAEDRICFVAAVVERTTREEPGLVVNRVMTVEQAQRERTTGLVLDLGLDAHDAMHVEAAARVLQRNPGNCPVFVYIRDGAGKQARLKAADEFRVNPVPLVKGELEMILGQGRVQFSRHAGGNGRGVK